MASLAKNYFELPIDRFGSIGYNDHSKQHTQTHSREGAIMIKTTMCVGLLDKDTKAQEITTIDAFKIVSNIFASTTGGATITEGMGVYTHDNGEVVIEKTLVCVIYGDNNSIEIEQAATMIKMALNQEAVTIETCESNSRFF